MNRKERLILFILSGLNFTHILDFMIMMPLGNYLMPSLGISPWLFTLLVSAYSLSAFVSGVAAALIVDRFDRKKVLIVCYLGFLAGTLACGLANTYGLLLASRIFAGIFGGVIGAQIMAIVADLFSYERRGAAMGSVMSSFAIASIIGVPFSLYLTNMFHDDWHIPFLLVVAVGIVVTPFLLKIIPPVNAHILHVSERNKPKEIIRTILITPAQRSALIFSCLLMMGHFLIIPFINPYMEFNKGFSKDLTPMIYLVGGAASLIAAFYLGRLSDRKGKLVVFSFSVFLSLFMVLLITKMPDVPFSVVLAFFAIWFVFATGRAVTAQAMISEVVPPAQRGSFMSFNGSVQQLGTGMASIVAGFIIIKDKSGSIRHFDWLGYLSIVVLAGTLFLGRFIFTKMERQRLARTTITH